MRKGDLIAIAEELNEVLGLEPAIPKKAGIKELKSKIKEASELIDPQEDELSEEVWNGLIKLGFVELEDDDQEEKQEEEEEEKPEPEPEPEPEEEKSNKKSGKKKSAELSNKAKVYQAWQKGETDINKLNKIVANAVKETTIKSWVNQWKKGKNLPAIAKK